MQQANFSYWPDLVAEVDQLRPEPESLRPLLFRGHADAQWELLTTLERNGHLTWPFLRYFSLINRAQSQIETFTQQKWDIESFPEMTELTRDYDQMSMRLHGLKCYGYMSYLRHNGFPSPLLDWTQSLYVAAFFAYRFPTQPPCGQIAIFVFVERPSKFKMFEGGDAQIFGLGPYFRSARRHFLQQSEYTMCLRFENNQWFLVKHDDVFADQKHYRAGQDLLWKFTLPWSERSRVLSELDAHGLNAFSMFETDEALLETIAFREMARGTE